MKFISWPKNQPSKRYQNKIEQIIKAKHIITPIKLEPNSQSKISPAQHISLQKWMIISNPSNIHPENPQPQEQNLPKFWESKYKKRPKKWLIERLMIDTK